MLRTHPPRSMLVAAALAAALSCAMSAHAQPSPDRPPASAQAEDVSVTPVLTMPLAGVPGKELSMSVIDYAPGAASPPHRHNADVFVYVLEGTVVMQVEGGESATLTVGQTFHELPTDIHAVSRNASSTEPARFLAILVKGEGAPATVPVTSGATPERGSD